MKKYLKYCLLVWIAVPVWAQQTEVIGPDSHLKVNVALKQGKPVYSVTYKEKIMLEDSPLGVVTDIGDFWKSHATLTLLATQDCPLWLQYD